MGACLTPPLSVARPLHPHYCNRLTFHNGSSHSSETPLQPKSGFKIAVQTSRTSTLYSYKAPLSHQPTHTPNEPLFLHSTKGVFADISIPNASFPQRNTKTHILRTCIAWLLCVRIGGQIGWPYRWWRNLSQAWCGTRCKCGMRSEAKLFWCMREDTGSWASEIRIDELIRTPTPVEDSSSSLVGAKARLLLAGKAFLFGPYYSSQKLPTYTGRDQRNDV